MNQKVWVIDGMNQKGTSQRNPIGNPPTPEKKPDNLPMRTDLSHTSPAFSFSLSLFFWGSGHLSIREYRSGWIFMSCMFLFYPLIFSAVYFRDAVNRFILRSDIPASVFFGGSVIFLLSGVFLSLFNAVHAYYKTARLRFEPFPGVRNEFWPLLASLLCPGWGQFLNGQPRKGLFFLTFGLMGAFSLVVFIAAMNFWPALNAGSGHFVLDIFLATALSLVPTSFLMWIVSAYDSYLSCVEPVRKRPVKKRWQYLRERMRTHGLSRVLLPGLKVTVIRGLLLAVPVMAGIFFFPKEYYLDSMEKIRLVILSHNLELTSELIRLATDFIK